MVTHKKGSLGADPAFRTHLSRGILNTASTVFSLHFLPVSGLFSLPAAAQHFYH